MRKQAIIMVVVGLAVAVVALAQDAAPRRRVAVLGFKNLRNDPETDWVGAATAETLTSKLARLRYLMVIERSQIQKVVEEQDLQATLLVDSNASVETGRVLGAQSIVVGSFVVAERQVQFNVRIVDVETSEVLDAVTQGGAQSDVMNLPTHLVEKVVGSLSLNVETSGGERRVTESGAGVSLSAVEKEEVAARVTGSQEAYEAYGRGLDLDSKHRWREAQTEFERAVQLDPSFGLAWLQLGSVCEKQGAWSRALESYTKAKDLFLTQRDEKNLAWTLNNMGRLHRKQGRYDEARKLYEESLAMRRRLGDEPGVAYTLGSMGNLHEEQGRYDEAMKLYEESLAIDRRLGNEPGVGMTLNDSAIVHEKQGRYDEAMKLYEESLAIDRRLGNEPGVAISLGNMGNVHYYQGRHGQAMKLYEESLAMMRRLGDEPGVADTLHCIVNVCIKQRRYDEAMRLGEESLAMKRRLGDEPGVAMMLHTMGLVRDEQRRYDEAMKRRLGDEWGMTATLTNIGELHRKRGRYDQAMKFYEESLVIARRLGYEPCVAQTLYNMVLLLVERKEYAKALPLAREAAGIAHRMGFSDMAKYDKLVAGLERAARK